MEETTIDIKEIPHNIELEQEILGNVILDDKLMENLSATVKDSVFHLEQHRKIYTAMLYLYYNNVGIGYETLANRLEFKYKDNMVDYLIELGGCVASTSSYENKLELLIDIYRKRELYQLYKKRLQEDLTGIASANLVKEIEGKIEGMGITSNITNTSIHDYIDEWVKNLEDETPSETFKTGFKVLDEMIKIKRGKLLIIAARPGCGKSALASKMVRSFCEQNYNPLFISLEMGKKEFLNRVVSEMTMVSHTKIDNKSELTALDWQSILVAKEKIKNWKFEFNDDGTMKIEQLIGLCKYLKKRDRLDILVVDYLQLIDSNQFKNQKQNQVEHISKGLKQIALSLEIPVIALSQLSRASVDNGQIREPLLSDLRSSGSIEQDADVVMMLHTKDVENTHDKRYITLFIRKNRQGKMGRTDFIFKGDNLKFIETKMNWDTKQWETVEEENFDKEDGISIEEDDLPF